MNIVLNELKKIFNLKTILLLILINIVMYFLFIEFNISVFPNGRPSLDIYNMFVEMKDDYGEFMDENEFQDFKEKYEEKKEEAFDYIKSREDLKKFNFNSYEEYMRMLQTDKELYEIQNNIIFEEKIDVFWELPWREEYIYWYENKEEMMLGGVSNEKEEERVKEILEKELETSVFTEVVFSNYNDFIKNVAMTILMSIIFIITPIYIRDNKEKINYLQYSSKIGRKIFKKKIIAGILGSFILVSLQIIIFFALYSTNNTSMFFNSNINSIYSVMISWYNLNFIQYIGVTILGIYILAFIFTLISMVVSSIGRNYITLIGIQLPIALFGFTNLLNYLISFMTSIRYPKYFIGLAYIILLSISIIAVTLKWKKEKKSDILY